ncbi:Hypothetical predicted protein [Marmota monax]|uniref:EGF-like domain-containing protein n=1 Tax=Marmota monax TaxID=9995 RepID=A0A5E4CHN9_MARMO|nr:Hypothetical predicted protein [Marmota monax]
MRPPPRTAFGFLLLLLLPPAPDAARKLTPCQQCRALVDKFNQGMANTAKKNFGGGNTAWEEKTLSKYEFSEIRLLEILEGLCESSDFECNQMVEQQEERLEAWWLQLKKKYPDLFEWFCVQTLKVCCSPGTYGPDCSACQGGSKRPCSGNGHCNGDGSRQGDGSCQCHIGYQGPLCKDCVSSYFSSLRNETHNICTACDESCKTCSGPTNRDCLECEEGWARVEDTCLDVDECAAETPPCSETQYCENVNGSYTCEGLAWAHRPLWAGGLLDLRSTGHLWLCHRPCSSSLGSMLPTRASHEGLGARPSPHSLEPSGVFLTLTYLGCRCRSSF